MMAHIGRTTRDILTLQLVGLLFILCFAFGQRLTKVFKKSQGMRATSPALGVSNGISLEDCLTRCVVHGNKSFCNAINFKESDGTCEVLSDLEHSTSSDLNWTLFRIQAKSSCLGWVQQGLQAFSGTYVVDPDGPGGVEAFPVECNMATTPPTIKVYHNQTTRQHVTGYEDPNFYSLRLFYNGVSHAQLRALVSSSTSCSQYVKKDCYHACTFYRGTRCDYWKTVDGRKLEYWAGDGTNVTRGCGCRLTDSCSDGEKCNCDRNDDEWRSDEGFVTNKMDLPISEIMIGDTGSSYEDVYIIAGPLECIP